MDLRAEAYRDLFHYAPGRVVGFHTRTEGGFKPGEKWTVRQTNCETVQRSKLQSRDRLMLDLWEARPAEIVRGMGMER
jgi:hypothetical protein